VSSLSSDSTQVYGPAQPFAELTTVIRESIAEPQVLRFTNWPSPVKVYQTPMSAAPTGHTVGAPVAVALPVDPFTVELQDNAIAFSHKSFGVTAPQEMYSQDASSMVQSAQ